jgi:tetratricopeptide (TPR) repeat protein
MERAMQLNPRYPGWYWFPALWDAYRKGDYRSAVNLGLKLNLPGFFAAHSTMAAAYAQLGESEAAGKALRELLRLRPDAAITARERLEKWHVPEMVDHLIDGLRKAGLETSSKEAAAVDLPSV